MMRTTKAFFSAACFIALTTGAHAQIDPLAINLDEVDWMQPDVGPGFPAGVQVASQGLDPITGGEIYHALFPAGSHFELHWHTHDEYVVVVAGNPILRLGEEDHQLSVGSYVAIPGELTHSWTVPDEGQEVIVLVRRAGPADFHFVKETGE